MHPEDDWDGQINLAGKTVFITGDVDSVRHLLTET
jgi:hypothetical protein